MSFSTRAAMLDRPPMTPAAASNAPVVTFGLLAILIIVFVAEQHFAVAPSGPGYALPPLDLIVSGGAVSSLVTAYGQWFRLITAIFLHQSLLHLVLNGIVLLAAGWMLEKSVGRCWLLAIFMLGGLGGSLMSIAENAAQNPVSVGASGAIMAMLATLLALTFREPSGARRLTKQFGLGRLLIPALFPTARNVSAVSIDIAGHVGGTIAGVAIGVILVIIWNSNQPAPGYRRAAGASAAACLLLLAVGLDRGIATGFALASDYAETQQDWSRALTIAQQALALSRNDFGIYNVKAEAEFALGNYLPAAADFETSGKLNPSWGYAQILASLSRIHAGADFDREFQNDPQPQTSTWPAPVMSFYQGRISKGDLLVAVNSSSQDDSETPAQKYCEFAFYLGEYDRFHGRSVDAANMFDQAISLCPHDYLEYQLALVDKARL